MIPGQTSTILISPDAVGLRPIVGASFDGPEAGEVYLRMRRLQTRDTFESPYPGLGDDILTIKVAGVQKIEERPVIVERQLAGHARAEDVVMSQAGILGAAP